MTGLAIATGGQALPLVDWTIPDLLEWAAGAAPEALAAKQWDTDSTTVLAISFAELLDVTQRLAGVYAAAFGQGDKVAIWGINRIEWLICELAVIRTGAVLVTLDPALSEHELHYMLQASGAVALIMDRSYRGRQLGAVAAAAQATLPALRATFLIDDCRADAARAAAPMTTSPAQPHDTALIVFTSGTTGKPKAVELHHYGLINNARLTAFRIGLPERAIWLNPLPAYAIGGAATINLGAMSRLNTQIFMGQFSATLALRMIEAERIAWMPCVPAMLIPMIEHAGFAGTDISSMKQIWTGGTTIAPEFVNMAREKMGTAVQVIYGQTEAGGALTMTMPDCAPEVVTRTVGPPIDYATIRIADLATGETVPYDTIGEIRLLSPFMTKGYLNNPEATAASFDAEGYLKTGDLGVVDADGNIRITGRLKEMIIRGGKNVYPREIEDLLNDFPGITEAAVVGVPHPRWGEEIAVAIRTASGQPVDMGAAREFLKSRIAAHKIPSIWRRVEDFPRSTGGKIFKPGLVKLFAEDGKDG